MHRIIVAKPLNRMFESEIRFECIDHSLDTTMDSIAINDTIDDTTDHCNDTNERTVTTPSATPPMTPQMTPPLDTALLHMKISGDESSDCVDDSDGQTCCHTSLTNTNINASITSTRDLNSESVVAEDQSQVTVESTDKEVDKEVGQPSRGPALNRSRHPLTYGWQLWFWRADPGVKVVWRQALQRVCKPFHTIEDFWCLYHHIVCVQQLVPPSDYCVFKAGVEPMWEDSHNILGGKWSLEFPKSAHKQTDPRLDEVWLEVLLCLIGEGFNEFGQEICGAVVNIRSKGDRISVWTADANKSVANLRIGEILKMRTRYERQLKYEAHETSQRIAKHKEHLYTLLASRPPNHKPTRRSCVF